MFTTILNTIALFLNSILSWIIGVVCGILRLDTAFLTSDNYNEAVNFFFFTTIKIFFVISIVIFLVTTVRSFFPAAKINKMLSGGGAKGLLGYVFAALLGAAAPFCTCSAISVFFGLLGTGVPLGISFSFLVAAPLVDEIALGMLWVNFGWKIAIIYVVTGVSIGIAAGLVINKLNLKDSVEDYMFGVNTLDMASDKILMKDRMSNSLKNVIAILKRVWLFILIGIAISAAMHVWLQGGTWIAQYTGKDNPFAVIVAVAIGIPLYNNVAGVIPVIKELTRIGVPIGTALSFMMAVAGLSLPEIIILKKALKPKLLMAFVGIVGSVMVIVGYAYNLFLD